jgi:5-methylcytosine-specific restriction endonuclease McrA
MANHASTRHCLADPIGEFSVAKDCLDAAANAHLCGRGREAEMLIEKANMPAIRKWLEAVWGKKSPHVRFRLISNAPRYLTGAERASPRMPDAAARSALLARDGYHCRFCGIPVIRAEVRRRVCKVYEHLKLWGRKNIEQHAAFQAMWVQYDHVLPIARGGTSTLDNLVITCTACNYGRMDYTLDEVGLTDPRKREPMRSSWDGLERFR